MGSSWLEGFVGQHVSVVTGSVDERSDVGTLLAIGDGWLQVAKDNGEMMLIPSSAIRVVKLLNMTQSLTVEARNVPPPPTNVIKESNDPTLP